MEFLQSLLNKIQPPITFSAEISEPVARITLKKLCGSAWDECEFNGEISQNSFSFMKNTGKNIQTAAIVAKIPKERRIAAIRPIIGSNIPQIVGAT